MQKSQQGRGVLNGVCQRGLPSSFPSIESRSGSSEASQPHVLATLQQPWRLNPALPALKAQALYYLNETWLPLCRHAAGLVTHRQGTWSPSRSWLPLAHTNTPAARSPKFCHCPSTSQTSERPVMNTFYMKSYCPNETKAVGLKQQTPIRPNYINQPKCRSAFSKAAAAAYFYEVVGVGFFSVCLFNVSACVSKPQQFCS